MHEAEYDRDHPRYRPVTRANVAQIPQWDRIPADLREGHMVVSTVLPFRTNRYVLDELIDWSMVPDDPIFRLTFMHRDMLALDDYLHMRALLRNGADAATVRAAADAIRLRLNPHPAGQLTHNVPKLNGQPLPGLQHKYDETVLFFPTAGQSCHHYCTFCFRWAQFCGLKDMKFGANETDVLVHYLRLHREVSDVLVTGGDPMVMNTRNVRRYVEPLLDPGLDHIRDIRIGTKAVATWPHRFVDEEDADDLLRLFEQIVASGRHLSIMGHYNHPAELRTAVAREAVRRIRATGANVRMQSPLVRHVNDDSAAWRELWTEGVRLGAIPYYLFVERDTGPMNYFQVPLYRAWEIFRDAYRRVGGLARTVRGPSMSAFPGKVLIDGVAEVHGEKVFCLQFLQARDPSWVRRPFFARFDRNAAWLDDLEPAFEQDRFFYEQDLDDQLATVRPPYGVSPLLR